LARPADSLSIAETGVIGPSEIVDGGLKDHGPDLA
jgi:hypothetical protein